MSATRPVLPRGARAWLAAAGAATLALLCGCSETSAGLGEATVVIDVVAAETGAPISGAAVFAWPQSPVEHEIMVSDGDVGSERVAPRTNVYGRARLHVAPGRKLRIALEPHWIAPHEETTIAPLAPGATLRLLFEVPTEPDLVYRGRVQDKTGRPIAGAQVRVNTPDLAGGDVLAGHAATDARGEFCLLLRSWRADRGRVEARGYGSIAFVPQFGHETRDEAQVLTLYAAASITGHVAHARGERVEELEVRARLAPHETLHDPWLTRDALAIAPARTGADGAYRLDDLPAGIDLELELLRDGALVRVFEAPVRLEPAEERTVDWTLGAGASVRGEAVCVDCGSPARQRSLVLRADCDARPFARVSTDGSGAFVFEDVPNGEWHVALAARSDEAALVVPVRVVDGDATSRPRVDVHRGLVVRGVVVDAAGEPIAEARVTGVVGPSPGDVATTWSDGEGRYELGPLVPGPVRVSAQASETCFVERDDVLAGEDEVVLQLRDAASVEVLVVDARTGAPCRAAVALRDGSETASVATDWRGRARLVRRERGRGVVIATTPDGRAGFAAVRYAAGATESVRIEVEPAAELLVRRDGSAPALTMEIESRGVLWHRRVVPGRGIVRLWAPPGDATVRFLEARSSGAPAAHVVAEQSLRLALGTDTLAVAPR